MPSPRQLVVAAVDQAREDDRAAGVVDVGGYAHAFL